MIISILQENQDLKIVIDKYLEIFNLWQKDDLVNLITEIAGYYYYIIQIKISIEHTNNENTIQNWLPYYENLLS